MTAMETRTPGHLFMVKADVSTIDCDAWLLPTDLPFKVNEGFAAAVGLTQAGYLQGFRWDRRAVPFNPRSDDGKPLVVLGKIGKAQAVSPADVDEQVADLVRVVGEFIDVAKANRKAKGELLRLALPVIGTRDGGLSDAKGHAIKRLISELRAQARDTGVDIVLCADNDVTWSAIQKAREDDESAWGLTGQERRLAIQLAKAARAGQLVLFIGAGVSSDAGLPGWQELLNRIRPTKLSDEQRAGFEKLDFRDQATLIEQDLGSPAELRKRIEQELDGYQYIGLTHALLASLGVRESITTNYDKLYERACTKRGHTVDQDLVVLPYHRAVEGRPWLLKLHGSVDQHDHIVLTRSDYLKLARDRSALFGIVQALLATKHLLFVGYSLTDEDFHRLIDEIRIAIDPIKEESSDELGTVLTIQDTPLDKLWKGLLQIHRIGSGSIGPSGRRVQIILDRVAHLATPYASYLLDSSFEGLLSPDEIEIARALQGLERSVEKILEKDARQPTALAVQQVLERFGSTDRDSRRSGK
ncbi:SIR2 family protein [Mycolicibacter terrae]|nr:SIR2 family protein [Mycolicibacter terrae]